MKGKHCITIRRKSGFFNVCLCSELMTHRQLLVKFFDEDDAHYYAERKARILKVGYDREIK